MRKSRLSGSIQRRFIEHFVSGSTVRTAASLVGVNKSTAAVYFHRLREIIRPEDEDASPLFFGESKSTRATSVVIVYSDTFISYNMLDVSSFKHYRIINHSEPFSDQKNHINELRTSGIRPSILCADSTASRYPLPPLIEEV